MGDGTINLKPLGALAGALYISKYIGKAFNANRSTEDEQGATVDRYIKSRNIALPEPEGLRFHTVDEARAYFLRASGGVLASDWQHAEFPFGRLATF